MPKHSALPGLRDVMNRKLTRRKQHLAEMDAVAPWGRLLVLIAPHYPCPAPAPRGGRHC
jgi:hypothetical protein